MMPNIRRKRNKKLRKCSHGPIMLGHMRAFSLRLPLRVAPLHRLRLELFRGGVPGPVPSTEFRPGVFAHELGAKGERWATVRDRQLLILRAIPAPR